MNELKNSQLAVMVMLIPIVFKVAMLPSLMFALAGNGITIAIAIMTLAETLQCTVIVFILKNGGISEISRRYGVWTARLLSLPFVLSYLVKSMLFVNETTQYITNTFFYNITHGPILLAIILCACYLATKGTKIISYMFTLSLCMLPFILISLFSGDLQLHYIYLIPFRTNTAADMASVIWVYAIYMFDISPLMFAELNKGKYKKPIIFSLIGSFLTVIFYCSFVASYGNASHLAPNALNLLASFNTIVSEIGELSLPSSLMWLSVGICMLSLKLFGIGAVFDLFKVNRTISITVSGVVIFIICYSVFCAYERALEATLGWVSAVVVAIEILVPATVALLLAKKARKRKLPNPALEAESV